LAKQSEWIEVKQVINEGKSETDPGKDGPGSWSHSRLVLCLYKLLKISLFLEDWNAKESISRRKRIEFLNKSRMEGKAFFLQNSSLAFLPIQESEYYSLI
jgi:hypothetical protein